MKRARKKSKPTFADVFDGVDYLPMAPSNFHLYHPKPEQPRVSIGKNIQTLMAACGWNISNLNYELFGGTTDRRKDIRKWMGTATKPVKEPSAKNLAELADAFTMQLKPHGIIVTAEDLKTRNFPADPAIVKLIPRSK